MTTYFKLCTKNIKTEDNKEFPVYFGYRMTKDKEGKLVDLMTISEDGQPIAKSYRVALGQDLKKKLLLTDKFPYLLELEDEDYNITIDKDKNKKPRLDKEGKTHKIVIIMSCKSFEHIETPKVHFEDLD